MFNPASMKQPLTKSGRPSARTNYAGLVNGIGELLEAARHATARVANTFMTVTYWEVGRRIVEFEQGGRRRAEYGDELLRRLAVDLTCRHGRGFSAPNLHKFRQLYVTYPPRHILSTLSIESSPKENCQTLSGDSAHVGMVPTASAKSVVPNSAAPSIRFSYRELSTAFPLPWSTYVRLLSVKSDAARYFYETEALRGGWSVRQLDRQINSLFYERTALSRNKAAMLKKGAKPRPGDALTADEAVRDPLVLEFLGLRDEYSETELEDALIRHLETFLLELGGDFAFVGRQRRLRIDDEWFRVDLHPTRYSGSHIPVLQAVISRGKSSFTAACTASRRPRPQARHLHPRRCRPNASLRELRARALDARRRKPARRPHPLLQCRPKPRPLRARQPAQQSPRPRIPPGPAG